MNIFETLQFSKRWIDLGLISPDKLVKLEREWSSSEDRNPEHYRWRIFHDFVEARKSIDENMARALYDLGVNDPDPAMGGSIMATILRRKECPIDLLETASESERKFLSKIAKERLATRTG